MSKITLLDLAAKLTLCLTCFLNWAPPCTHHRLQQVQPATLPTSSTEPAVETPPRLEYDPQVYDTESEEDIDIEDLIEEESESEENGSEGSEAIYF